ncbi:MAG: hypothetical protein WA858_19835 [Xanthobacteraceae bacterium]
MAVFGGRFVSVIQILRPPLVIQPLLECSNETLRRFVVEKSAKNPVGGQTVTHMLGSSAFGFGGQSLQMYDRA